MYYLVHGQYPADDIIALDIDMPGCVKGSGGAMFCGANNTAYNYNGNINTGQRYDVYGVYGPSDNAGHIGKLAYIMVLDNDPSNDKGKIFCYVYSAQDYTAVKVCESMGGKKVRDGLYQL